MPRFPVVAAAVLALALGWGAGPGQAQTNSASQAPATGIPGATLESVLVPARQLSPELATRALDTEAARARVMMAGSLPDPKLQVMSDDADRTSGPRMNRMTYTFEQDIPLWGRRDLRRDAAQAEVGQMQALARDADVELTQRVKVAFARYYAAWQAVHRTADLHKAIDGIAQVARERYAQGRGEQQDVFRAGMDSTRTGTDIVRLEADLKTAQGQLNALLLRPTGAPLAPPERPRPLPDARGLDAAALFSRARQANPGIAADAAAISEADANRKLADKTWRLDITLGAGAVQRPGWGPAGYQTWIGVKVPLQWGLHEGEIRQAAAQAQAAQTRQDVREQQIRGDLAEAVAAYEGARRTADLIRRQLLPQAEALVRSGAASYAVDRTDLVSALRNEHDLSDIRLQLLAAQFDAQRQLAAIERLIGGDL